MDEIAPPMPTVLRKEISGRLTNVIVQFARAKGLDPRFLWEGLGVDGETLTDVNTWVSAEVVNMMMARLREQTGDLRIMEQVGLAVPALKAFGFMGIATFLLKDPTRMVNRFVRDMVEVFTKISTMQVLEISPQRVIIIHQVKPGYSMPKDLCYFARGCFRALPKTWGLRLADVVEEACQAEGASACRYRVAWPRPSVWHRVKRWIKGQKMQERLVQLLTEQNALIEAKYEEALRKSAELEQAYFRIMASLMEALDVKDPYTRDHSRMVAAYAVEIARAEGFSEAEIEQIRRAALLHDIGKIGVPEHILLKPGPLNDEEVGSVRLHPLLGEKILQPLSFLGPIIQMVAQEHERFDGRGYPRGLRGDQIHWGARIISVADALDAITSARPYRNLRTFQEAVAEIQRCSGSQFDPTVVEAFARALPRLETIHQRDQQPQTRE